MLKFDDLDKTVDVLLQKAGERAAGLAKQTTLFKTSKKFRDQIITQPAGQGVQMVISQAPWSSYLEEGTSPHTINGKPLLHFYWAKKDVWVTTKSVHHPGTQPKPYMSEAAKETDAIIPRLWEQITK
jgi:hypothetical protein